MPEARLTCPSCGAALKVADPAPGQVLRCGQCGKMIEFQNPAIEAALREVCRQHHFNPSGHTFIIRGTCADCNRTRVTRRLLDLV